MGKLARFEVILDATTPVIYAGQTVQGHVNIILNQPLKVRGIRLQIMGMATVRWTESGSDKTVNYQADEEYMKKERLLFGQWPSQGSNKVELPAGQHTYPFKYILPQSLPSSFEGEDGYVRYWLKATIDLPWQFDPTVQAAFAVAGFLDLNREPAATKAVQGYDDKILCCWCCKSGPISAVIRIDRGGFVPGEAIPLNVEITNNSSRKIDYSKVSLKMLTTFYVHPYERQHEKTVASLIHDGIDVAESDIWSGEKLVIPPIPPSFLIGCSIIDIHYLLELTVSPSGPSFDLKIPLDIIIGTVPLYHIVEQFPPLPPSQSTTTLPPTLGGPSGAPAGLSPSDREGVFGTVNIREQDDNEYNGGNLNFTPQHQPTALPLVD